MSLDNLSRRLSRIEGRRRPTAYSSAVRIITESDADATRQIAALTAAGQIVPGVLIIDRRLVDAAPRDHL